MNTRPLGTAVPCLLALMIFALPAFAQAPPEAWTHSWNGPGSLTDEVVTGLSDSAGNLYATGSSFHAVAVDSRDDIFLNRLDSTGALVWSQIWGGPGSDLVSDMVITPTDQVALVALTGSTARQISTLLYAPDGTLAWEAHHAADGSHHFDHPPRLAAGADGSLTVVGNDQDLILVLRYAATGELLWQLHLPDLGFDRDRPGDVALGPDGSVYVAALIYGITAEDNADVLFKIDPDGQLAWYETELGNFGSFFEFVEVEVGPDGHPVMVGNPESTCGLFEERIWKVDAATGQRLWTNHITEDPCDVLEPYDFIMDTQGNSLVASSGRTEGTSSRLQVAKYDPAGQLLWFREYTAPGALSGMAHALAVDAAGSVYVTGISQYAAQDRDFATLKYSATGDLLWTVEWAAALGGNDFARAVDITPQGDVAVFGLANNGLPTYSDAVTILYDQPGVAPVSPQPALIDMSVNALLNPFSGSTRIRFALGRDATYNLSIFDIKGRRVRQLSQGFAAEGPHEIGWAGRDDQGRNLPSGVYLLMLETPRGVATSRVGLIR